MRAYVLALTSTAVAVMWAYGCSDDATTDAGPATTTGGPSSSTSSTSAPTTVGPGSGGSTGGQGGSMGGSMGGQAGSMGGSINGQGGSGGSINGQGGAGGMMNGQGGGQNGVGGSMSVGGMGGSMNGQGGGSMCMSCSQFVLACQQMSGCPSTTLLCPSSAQIFAPLQTCTCGICGSQCQATCTNMGVDQMGCFGCLAMAAQSQCQTELQACLAD